MFKRNFYDKYLISGRPKCKIGTEFIFSQQCELRELGDGGILKSLVVVEKSFESLNSHWNVINRAFLLQISRPCRFGRLASKQHFGRNWWSRVHLQVPQRCQSGTWRVLCSLVVWLRAGEQDSFRKILLYLTKRHHHYQTFLHYI